MSHLYAKLGTHSRTEAVERARAMGLLPPTHPDTDSRSPRTRIALARRVRLSSLSQPGRRHSPALQILTTWRPSYRSAGLRGTDLEARTLPASTASARTG